MVQKDLKPTDGLFGFITDIQSAGDSYMTNHYKNIGKVAEWLPMTHIIDGGDFIMGNEEKEKTVELLRNYSRLVHKNNIPYLVAKGNHDDNGFYATTHGTLPEDLITDEEWYALVTKYNERYKNVVVDKDNPAGGYCYIDAEVSKIRTIVVNVCDVPYKDSDGNPYKDDTGKAKYNAMQNYAIREQQLKFVREALKCADKSDCHEWGIIVCMHFPDAVTINNNCLFSMLASKCGLPGYSENKNYTYKYEHDDFGVGVSEDDPFEYNFYDYRGDVIAVISGHKHYDTSGKIWNNFTSIIVDSSYPDGNDNRDSRPIGTVDEDCFDIVRVDREEKKVYCYRFGGLGNLTERRRSYDYTTTVGE